MKCSKCNAEIDDNAIFCPECGSKIEKPAFCANCGVKLEYGATYCSNCGEKVGSPINDIQKKKECHIHGDDMLATDTIICPNKTCGKEVSVEFTECPFCGTPLNSHILSGEGGNEKNEEAKGFDDFNLHFVTHEPTVFQKILQLYWLQPKAWRLKEFKVSNGNIYISVMNGKELKAPIKDCRFYYDDADKYNRMGITVRYGDKKIKFFEIPFMLNDDEWAQIIDFCMNTCNSKRSKSNKIAIAIIIVGALAIIAMGIWSLLAYGRFLNAKMGYAFGAYIVLLIGTIIKLDKGK